MRTRDQKEGQVPGEPDHADEEARDERRVRPLEPREGDPAPPEFLVATTDQEHLEEQDGIEHQRAHRFGSELAVEDDDVDGTRGDDRDGGQQQRERPVAERRVPSEELARPLADAVTDGPCDEGCGDERTEPPRS